MAAAGPAGALRAPLEAFRDAYPTVTTVSARSHADRTCSAKGTCGASRHPATTSSSQHNSLQTVTLDDWHSRQPRKALLAADKDAQVDDDSSAWYTAGLATLVSTPAVNTSNVPRFFPLLDIEPCIDSTSRPSQVPNCN